MGSVGLNLYLLFTVSWFTHATARLPVLGAIRLDFLLLMALASLAFLQRSQDRVVERTPADLLIRALMVYVVLTLPFVQWPGSVVQSGLPNLIKAGIFYYFTVVFVRSESDLKRLLVVFVACQVLRVLEPLYLHLTSGYWGAIAYSEGGEHSVDRLAGAPHDVINPNGLAFVICTALPFLFYLSGLSFTTRIAAVAVAPACLYALLLTGSRTGMLGLAVIYLAMLIKSRRRLAVILLGVAVVVSSAPLMTGDMKDRYLSILGMGTKHAATAAGRIEGVASDFQVALRRPLFGHGLGTSQEANFHVTGNAQPSHNLYTEVAQELGFVGLPIVVALIASVCLMLVRLRRLYSGQYAHDDFMCRLLDAVQVWLAVSLLFSFASYGLSSYEWYLLAGLAVAIQRLAHLHASSESQLPAQADLRPVLYVDFDDALRGAAVGRMTASNADGAPVPGAIDFLRQAVRHFRVVVCSPECARADGAGKLSGWLEAHGAPVRHLRFSAYKPLAGGRVDCVIPFAGRWPTMEELGASCGKERGDA